MVTAEGPGLGEATTKPPGLLQHATVQDGRYADPSDWAEQMRRQRDGDRASWEKHVRKQKHKQKHFLPYL
jgi:hypothetical protein